MFAPMGRAETSITDLDGKSSLKYSKNTSIEEMKIIHNYILIEKI